MLTEVVLVTVAWTDVITTTVLDVCVPSLSASAFRRYHPSHFPVPTLLTRRHLLDFNE